MRPLSLALVLTLLLAACDPGGSEVPGGSVSATQLPGGTPEPRPYAFPCRSDLAGADGGDDPVYIPGGSDVRGCVRDAAGRPVSGALVTLQPMF